jgi:hypothetical protein
MSYKTASVVAALVVLSMLLLVPFLRSSSKTSGEAFGLRALL